MFLKCSFNLVFGIANSMGIEATDTEEKLGGSTGKAENACGGSGASSKSHFMDFCCPV